VSRGGEQHGLNVLADSDYFCHQQYLAKVPNGYDCHANAGVPYPDA